MSVVPSMSAEEDEVLFTGDSLEAQRDLPSIDGGQKKLRVSPGTKLKELQRRLAS